MKGIYLFSFSLLLGIFTANAQSILRGKTVDFGNVGIYSVDENDNAKLTMTVPAGNGITVTAVAYGKDHSSKRLFYFEVDKEKFDVLEAASREGIKFTPKGLTINDKLYSYEQAGMPANFWDELLKMGRQSLGNVELKYQICGMDDEGIYVPEGVRPDYVSYKRLNYIE